MCYSDVSENNFRIMVFFRQKLCDTVRRWRNQSSIFMCYVRGQQKHQTENIFNLLSGQKTRTWRPIYNQNFGCE